MKKYKIILAYDGTDYCGWQYQPDKKTITNELQDTFTRIFGHAIKLLGASRTDAGVHALGQVASFISDLNIEPQMMMKAWNDSLPSSIVIRLLEEVPNSFHPIVYVKEKIYWYHFFVQRPLPFVQRYGHYVRQPLDLECLRNALELFVGMHDFRSFCSGWEKENTVRIINHIELIYLKRFGMYRIIFCGPGFLKHMIRRIVGACLQVVIKDLPLTYLQQILEQKNPRQTYTTAPAKGLMLYRVRY